jgi:photosystem II stability/assembly factor-like uncharacterized protein
MRPRASVKQVAMEIVLSLLLLGVAGASVFATPVAPTSESAVSQWDHYFGVAISGDRAYVVGSAGVVVTSDDRGRTWNRQILRRPSDRSEGTASDLCGIAMAPGGQVGWIVGEQGTIFKTIDSGKTWNFQPNPITNRLFSVAALSPTHACTVGSNGAFSCTTDGKKWSNVAAPSDLSYYDIKFQNDRTGLVAGEFETILRTNDGGRAWQIVRGGKVASAETAPYFTVAFLNDHQGIAAGQSGVAVQTSDGGITWTDLHLPAQASIYASAQESGPPSAGEVLLAGSHGLFLKENGSAKGKVDHISLADLTAVAVQEGLGIAVGMNGTVLLSADGSTWKAVP